MGVVLDGQDQVRGQVDSFVLEEKYLDESEITATISGQDVTTDIAAQSTVLALAGIIFLEDGLTAVGDGLTVTINNVAREKSVSGRTDENGAYSIANLDGQTFETTHVLTTAEVEANKIEDLDITTELLAVENRIFVVDGTVFLEDGVTPARSGLQILVDINGRENETATEDGAGYQVTFVDVLGTGILAKTGDEVTVKVTAVDLAEAKVVGAQSYTLKTVEIKAKRATIDVTTDLKAATKVLAVSGAVTLEKGKVIAPAGLKVVVGNAGITGQQSVTVDASGNYSVTFFDPLRIVAESGNQLEIMVTDSLEETFQSTHSLTAAEVKAGKAEINLETDLPARTNSLIVSGQTYLVGGEVKARSGLTVTILVGEAEGNGTTDGTGSYRVTLGDGTTAIAETDSEVVVTVNDGAKDRGSDSDRLTVADVITDLKQATNVLAISGSVLLEDGVTLVGSGL